MKRDDIQSRFVKEFAVADKAVAFRPAEFDKIESAFGIAIPDSFRAFMTRYGTIRCPSLLSLVVEEEAEQWDIHAFFPAEEIVEGTKASVAAGMRDGLIAFASDSMGNFFCFDRGDLTKLADDSPVWFFDHEFCEDSRLADSFDSWLAGYFTLKE